MSAPGDAGRGGAAPAAVAVGGRRRAAAVAAVALAVAVMVGACTSGPILANPAVIRPEPPPPTTAPVIPADPQPIVIPRDDGAHARLTEWWYYTGHLRDVDGGTWGFEFVIFRAERGHLPVSWASHLALTDEQGGTFVFAQRSEIGTQVDRAGRDPSGSPTGFNLAISGTAGGDTAPSGRAGWTMTGGGGRDHVSASALPGEATTSGPGGGDFGIDLAMRTDRPVALHNSIGYVDFGPAGGSYYYSRTRLETTGRLTVDGRTLTVDGIAWFDHQWGDFISVGGGWDWFAVNLDDGTDLTVSLVRAPDGGAPIGYGTLVATDGTTHHLEADAVTVTATGTWTSPRTGAIYPQGGRSYFQQIDSPSSSLPRSRTRSSTRGRRPVSSTGKARKR